MNIEFDVTLQCNFSCLNCNRHSNFNAVKDPMDPTKSVGVNLYQNTDVKMEEVKKFIKEVKENGTVKRIHLIGGEPLVHPFMDKICTLIRDELYGSFVPEIYIISNIHPKMLKAGTLDTPEQIIEHFPWKYFDNINLDHIVGVTRLTLQVLNQHINDSNDTPKDVIKDLNNFQFPIEGQNTSVKYILGGKYKLEKGDDRQVASFFYGIPVINYKPLSAKAEEHRCTLVAPYDSGQEMIKTCNIPRHCGINFSFDGYWPCSNGSAIARLFKMHDKYRKTSLPKSEADWGGVDENGNATVHNSDMTDICKLCQLAAKHPMAEKIHGRPVSISYRKAMGMEKDKESVSGLVVENHKKKLAKVPNFRQK